MHIKERVSLSSDHGYLLEKNCCGVNIVNDVNVTDITWRWGSSSRVVSWWCNSSKYATAEMVNVKWGDGNVCEYATIWSQVQLLNSSQNRVQTQPSFQAIDFSNNQFYQSIKDAATLIKHFSIVSVLRLPPAIIFIIS